MGSKRIKARRLESNFPEKQGTPEPDWSSQEEVAEFLRKNGFPNVPRRWGDLDPKAVSLDSPDKDGLAIAAAGTDTGVDQERELQVKRRLNFAHRYSGRRTGIRSDKSFSEQNLTEAATLLGLPPNWFLNGSTLVNTETKEVDGVGETDEIHQTPDFISHYEMLNEAAGYASMLSNWFRELAPASDVPLDDHVSVVRDACWAVANHKQGGRNKRSYKLDDDGELSLSNHGDDVRYLPFVMAMLPYRKEAEEHFYLHQRYNLQITGEERTALLHGLGLLSEYLGIMKGATPYSLDRHKGDSQYRQRLLDLHSKLIAVMGKDKESPFQKTAKKGSGRKAK